MNMSLRIFSVTSGSVPVCLWLEILSMDVAGTL